MRELLTRIEISRLDWSEIEVVNSIGWVVDGETIHLSENELRILRIFAAR